MGITINTFSSNKAMNLMYFVSLLFLFHNVNGGQPEKGRPSKSIFSNKKAMESIIPARYTSRKIKCDGNAEGSFPELYFPEIEFPASVLEARKPFYFKNDYNFPSIHSNDVKETFETSLNRTALQSINSKILNDYTLRKNPKGFDIFQNVRALTNSINKNVTSKTVINNVTDNVTAPKVTCKITDNSYSSESNEDDMNISYDDIDEPVTDSNEMLKAIVNIMDSYSNHVNIKDKEDITDLIGDENLKEKSSPMESSEESQLTDNNSTIDYGTVKRKDNSNRESTKKALDLAPLQKLKRLKYFNKRRL